MTKQLKTYAKIVMIISALLVILYGFIAIFTFSIFASNPVGTLETFTIEKAQQNTLLLMLSDYNKPIFESLTAEQLQNDTLYYHTLAASDQRNYIRKAFTIAFGIIVGFLLLFVIHYRIYKSES